MEAPGEGTGKGFPHHFQRTADAILAKLYQLSRNQSLELFRTKKVYINGRLCENNSCQLKSGDMVSARGYGRFLYYGAAGETRKGRLNAAAGVYR